MMIHSIRFIAFIVQLSEERDGGGAVPPDRHEIPAPTSVGSS